MRSTNVGETISEHERERLSALTAAPGDDENVFDIAHRVIEGLPLALYAKRTAKGLTLRQAAAVIGCGYSAIQRAESGMSQRTENILPLLDWLRSDD